MDRLECMVQDCCIRLYLYCLMNNHAHFLLETPLANLAQFMQRFETAYCIYFNLRHKRVGHLMQGRYGASPVQGDEYLLRLSRYIHLNPVHIARLREAPICQRLEALNHYPWSSYLGYIGAIPRLPFVDEAPLLQLVAGNSPNPRLAYRQFVESGLASSDDELRDLLHSSAWAIGDEEFQTQAEAQHTRTQIQTVCELTPGFRRRQGRRSKEDVIAVVADVCGVKTNFLMRRRYRCPARAIAAQMLWVHAGLSQKVIAQLLQMGGAASVCAQLRRLELLAKADRNLNEQLARIDARLKVDC